MTISFIIPTKGRDSLGRTLRSIECWDGDEILVEVDNPISNAWGNPQRNNAMARAKGDYLAFIDDDDWYVEGHREMMQHAINENIGHPILFQVKYPNGQLKWSKPEIVAGNITTQMILVPNNKTLLHTWEGKRNMADFIFVDKWGWFDDEVVWKEQVIALMGHDDGNYGT